MISDKAFAMLRERTGCKAFHAEPGDTLLIEAPGGTLLLVPSDETDAGFAARISEYERTGVNTFLRDYQKADPYPDENAVY